MAAKNIITKEVVLNNKSRKGRFLYIKEVGKPARYYKIDGRKGEKEGIEKYYLKKYKSVKKKTTRRQPSKGVKLSKYKPVKSLGKINKNISKGMSSAIIRDITKAGPTELKQAKLNILNPLVEDKKALEMLIKPQNLDKISWRFHYDIKVISDKGDVMSKIRTYNKSIDQVKKEIKNSGLIAGDTYDNEKFYKILKTLKNKGYNLHDDKMSGRISRVEVIVSFRKGK